MARNEVSAGGVVYRVDKDGVVVLVSKHSGYHKWVLPKGLVEKGESLEETAVREVEEETGIKAKIVSKIGEPEEYVYTLNGERIFKKVYYFLMEYQSGSHESHDFEMEEVKWVPMAEAIELMGYQGAKRVLDQAKQLLHKQGVAL